MEATQTERTANFALADANVVRMLLLELTDAMRARGVLQNEDIAGALLRMGWCAEQADTVAEEDGDISDHHAAAASLTTQAWTSRFGLEPSLYGLRKAQQEWLAEGENGKSPWFPDRIVERYAEDE